MDRFLNENCRRANILWRRYLTQRINNFELESHRATCGVCREAGRQDLELKKMLRRAVEKDRAPQSLIDTIRQEIRR